jgi:prevent-host-death family protein
MSTIPISTARAHLADLCNRVALRGERLVVQRRGKNLVALVPVQDLQLLEQLEDRLDLDAIRAGRDKPAKSWAQVKKALRL